MPVQGHEQLRDRFYSLNRSKGVVFGNIFVQRIDFQVYDVSQFGLGEVCDANFTGCSVIRTTNPLMIGSISEVFGD